jgi:hypothetical protein
MEERRPPKVHAPSDAQSDAQSYAMQVLTTEHWSLLATRSQGFNEAFARAGLLTRAEPWPRSESTMIGNITDPSVPPPPEALASSRAIRPATTTPSSTSAPTPSTAGEGICTAGAPTGTSTGRGAR